MPFETGLKPRINHALSEQHHLIKICMNCGTPSPRHLIETIIVSTEDKSPSAARKDLCGSCLVGHDVAVLRPSCNDWCFGAVLDYDSSHLHPFLMLFNDGKKEWANISPTPSKDYLNYIGIGLPETTSLPTTTTDQDSSIGTFYSSSMSSMSSFDQAQVFPLFDDENLIHLDSFSSLEDSILADKEVVVSPKKRGSKISRARVRPKNPNARASGVPWTPEEDRNLSAVVEAFKKSGRQLNWTNIAKDCFQRNGKQCRERYMNHLSSALTVGEWTPREDTVLFTSFFRTGKSWCKIAKVLYGRTDNAIKNRFHYIKRRINKDLRRKVQKYASMIPHADAPLGDEDSADAILQKTRKLLKVLAAESKRRDTYPYMKGYDFGPFIPVIDEAKMCPRCGLFVPSAQTGDAMCMKTKWCKACTMIPPYVAHDMLRECLDMRRDGDSILG